MAGTRPGGAGAICVLGDAYLDVVVRVSRPVAEETDTPAETLVGVGGQARLIAARGRDPAGELVFGTEAEAALVGDIPGAEMVVKLGPDGAHAGGRVYQALPATPVDSTGAGDAFAAGYLVGGMDLALRAAARAVSKMGAMP